MPVGLIEGAYRGVGLGHEFLRHCQRSRMLVHVLDMTSEDPLHDLAAINQELRLFNAQLSAKPQVGQAGCSFGRAEEAEWRLQPGKSWGWATMRHRVRGFRATHTANPGDSTSCHTACCKSHSHMSCMRASPLQGGAHACRMLLHGLCRDSAGLRGCRLWAGQVQRHRGEPRR